ncbi:Uridine nucleosidase 1 [Toxocara canis]|uniref:Uridine nucleosidase 1 n=1 Tax=Toxocara canis TaxID=6265 RepID=A0A0B2V7F0_TOXCA|nr:Uridine nucleosidase 1 [Toxocara canis]
MKACKKLIIDTDGAPDDVRAISLALQTPDIEVLAITTVHGVVSVDQAVANVSRTLRANRRTVPIYKGAFEPLVAMTGRVTDESLLFGKDGIGDKPDNFPKVEQEDFIKHDSSKPAALALIELLKQHNDVTLVCIGPLTNIALAMKLDADFVRRPKEMVIMGGNIYGVGNISCRYTSEFNFGGDPEAAHIVLAKMECPITLVPWEACFFEGPKYEGEVDFHAHLRLGTPLADFFSTVTSIGREILQRNNRQYAYCDEIAMAIALCGESIIKESKLMRASVELNGEFTRGQVACDWSEQFFNNANAVHKLDNSRRSVKFVISYDAKALDQLIHDAVRKSK